MSAQGIVGRFGKHVAQVGGWTSFMAAVAWRVRGGKLRAPSVGLNAYRAFATV